MSKPADFLILCFALAAALVLAAGSQAPVLAQGSVQGVIDPSGAGSPAAPPPAAAPAAQASAPPAAPPAERTFSDTPNNEGIVDPANLEKYALNDLSLSAIVVQSNPQHNIALLEAGGIGYSVREGSKVGENNGVVKAITETTVVIEELDPNGKPSGKTVTLALGN